MATLVTLNPIVRVARVPLHHREQFRVRTEAAGARRRRGVSGLRRNRGYGRNETEVRSFHDALQWRMCNGYLYRGFLFWPSGMRSNIHPRLRLRQRVSYISVSVATPTWMIATPPTGPFG